MRAACRCMRSGWPEIYGPGRSAFDRLREGSAQRVVKPGQVFSRIHVGDVARVVAASLAPTESGEGPTTSPTIFPPRRRR